MRKVIYTLNVDGYSPEVTALTYPLIGAYAHKIGAEWVEIRDRRFPGWPPVYEKLQIHRLAQENKGDWHIYIDSDALVHPETLDWTCFLPRDTVAHNGVDMANIRWRYDDYFLRDGRNIGSCNWLTIASSWCIDLWRPLEDLTLTEALNRIYPTVEERNTVITREHLLDDYVLSRNIARFGLKVKTLTQLEKDLGFTDAAFFWHAYTMPVEEKLKTMREVLARWKVSSGG
jgi:hypothetical protein